MLAGPGGICMIDYLPSEPFCNFVEEFPAFNRVGVLRGRYDRRCVHGIRLLVAARPDTVIFHRLGELSDPRRFHRHFRSEEHTSELQSLMRISYAVFCLKKKIQNSNAKSYKDTTNHIQHSH